MYSKMYSGLERQDVQYGWRDENVEDGLRQLCTEKNKWEK